jgi:hypothetical protein
MIVGSQPESDQALQKAGARVDAVHAIKRRGCRRLEPIVVRFCPEVAFPVPIRYEFEIPSSVAPPAALIDAGEVLAVV